MATIFSKGTFQGYCYAQGNPGMSQYEHLVFYPHKMIIPLFSNSVVVIVLV